MRVAEAGAENKHVGQGQGEADDAEYEAKVFDKLISCTTGFVAGGNEGCTADRRARGTFLDRVRACTRNDRLNIGCRIEKGTCKSGAYHMRL